MDEYEEAVLFTLAIQESRLDRLEYILGGPKKQPDDRPKNVRQQMQKLENSLQELSKKTALLSNVQELLSKHSDIVSKLPKSDEEEDEAGLDTAQKTAVVVERAPGFATTASQLKALEDQQIPQTEGFTKLANLQPRIVQAEKRQLEQALEISLLRRRSGMLTSRVKQIHLLGQARCWVEWQERLKRANQTVTRIEFKHKQEDEE